MTDTLYDQDFVVWTERQASALREAAREGSNLPLDWANLAEEIEDLGKEQRNTVRSLAFQILVHVLKLGCSPASEPGAGWVRGLNGFRRQLHRRLDDSPKLRSELDAIVDREFPAALGEVRLDFDLYGESEGVTRLASWKVRGVSAEELLDQELFPSLQEPRFVPRLDVTRPARS